MSLQDPQFPEKMPEEPARSPISQWHVGFMLLIILIIITLWYLVPYVAQKIAFSITRGQELARAQVALKELANLPPQVNRYPTIVKIIEPSVVGIQTTIHALSPIGESAWFEPEIRAMSQGSGVIVDSSGYILTNAHVISQAAQGGVTVQLSDGRIIQSATIVGIDPVTDLAVLKINAGDLTAAKWGDSSALEVGDLVLAVGSPYGLQETVTEGIISAKNRKVGIENVGYEDFLQTDAAVNPGNSGGPLVNMNAEVVGINTAIVGHASQGIGFAIPSDLAKKVYELLRTSGITRGWIGVALQNLTKSWADKLGLADTRGALVAQVASDSPAEQAGLKPGDVIVQWAKQSIDNSNDLRIAVAQTKPGANVPLAFYRNGKKQETTITVAERPNQVSQ